MVDERLHNAYLLFFSNFKIMIRFQTAGSRVFASDNSDHNARMLKDINVCTLPHPHCNVELGICISSCEISAGQTSPHSSKSDIAHHLNVVTEVKGNETRLHFAYCFYLRQICRQQ